MRITKVELKNFKRFTDLTLNGIPPDARLVLLTGSNGSGKSSVFDAFEIDNSRNKISPFSPSETALKRDRNRQEAELVAQRLIDHRKSASIADDPLVNITATSQLIRYYGRTSFRHVARLSEIKPFFGDLDRDENRPKSFVDRDNRFSDDIGFLTRRLVTEIFRENFSAKEVRERYINPINESLDRVFSGQPASQLRFLEIIPPGEGEPAKLTFTKGQSEFSYDYLSAGEKEAFNIIFNLFVRKDQYPDTVYFLDELDLHLHTRLQFNLLKEIIENWLPEAGQLWTASHSLGFIDYARQYENGVIIDFDDLDFDQPQMLFPQPKAQLDSYDIAVPKEMLFEIMRDKQIIVCENQNDEYYNLLALTGRLFVGMKDARNLFLQIKNDSRYHALRDRDFLSDTEIERIEKRYPNYRILRYYNFENYLYHPANIAEINPDGFDQEAYVIDILRQKNERYTDIILNLKATRQSYEELKINDIADKSPNSIADDLQSNEFERFYKFFDMKARYDKTMIVQLNLDKKRLVQTRWFRQHIEAVVNA